MTYDRGMTDRAGSVTLIVEELAKRWEARADHIELDHRGGVADNIRRCIFELCDEVGVEVPQ